MSAKWRRRECAVAVTVAAAMLAEDRIVGRAAEAVAAEGDAVAPVDRKRGWAVVEDHRYGWACWDAAV